MEMKEDKILIDIYADFMKGEIQVNIGHSTFEENITITLDQAKQLLTDLQREIEEWENGLS